MWCSKWGFRGNISVHSDTAEDITINSNKKNFGKFVSNLPILQSRKFWLNPLLFNGTLHTLHYAKADAQSKHQIYYGRDLFHYSDGGIASADYIIPPPASKEDFEAKRSETQPENWPKLHPRTRFLDSEEKNSLLVEADDSKPMCVIFHGLAGGSHENIVRALGEKLYKQDWAVVVLNCRGCARTKITTPRLFTALSTDDIKEFVVALRKRFPNRKLYGVGLSFGSAMLTNFLAESEENASLLEAAFCFGCPWDMVDSSYHIENSLSGKYLFGPSVAQFLFKLIKNNKKELIADPFFAEQVEKAGPVHSVLDFDTNYTAPLLKLKTAMEYYRIGSPINNILKIKTPMCILNSTDDPVVGIRLPILEAKANPYLALIETDIGGHLGFVKSDGDCWAIDLIDQFLNAFAKE